MQFVSVPCLISKREVWILNKRTTPWIQAAELLSRVARQSWIWWDLSSWGAWSRAAAPQLRWFQHLNRMLPVCFPLDIFLASLAGKRPSTHWRHSLAWKPNGIPQKELEGVTGEGMFGFGPVAYVTQPWKCGRKLIVSSLAWTKISYSYKQVLLLKCYWFVKN